VSSYLFSACFVSDCNAGGGGGENCTGIVRSADNGSSKLFSAVDDLQEYIQKFPD
jgi:hypothetical protein